MYDLKKIEEKLNKIQKKCRARTKNISDIKNFINELKVAREKALTTASGRKYLQKITGQESEAVTKNYPSNAESTCIRGSITRYGKIEIDVSRIRSYRIPCNGCQSKITPIYS